MPINRLHEPGPRDEGHPPDGVRYVSVLAQKWWELYQLGGNTTKAKAIEGRRFRASWAGLCARALAYRLTDTEMSDPPTLADSWRMGLGQLVHDALAPVMQEAFPGAEVEVAVDLESIGLDGSATVDILLTDGDRRVLIELKTINGFSFKSIATRFKSPPEGPRHSAVLQGALAAMAKDVDLLVIGYLSMELVGHDLAKQFTDSEVGRFAAEWHFDRDQYRELATTEIARVDAVMGLTDDAGPVAVPRSIPDPQLPPGALITHPIAPGQPNKGMWAVADSEGRILDAGTTWHCAYCSFRQRCHDDG